MLYTILVWACPYCPCPTLVSFVKTKIHHDNAKFPQKPFSHLRFMLEAGLQCVLTRIIIHTGISRVCDLTRKKKIQKNWTEFVYISSSAACLQTKYDASTTTTGRSESPLNFENWYVLVFKTSVYYFFQKNQYFVLCIVCAATKLQNSAYQFQNFSKVVQGVIEVRHTLNWVQMEGV